MPQIFYAPQFQALSNQGLPLPNARLHFFATGTTNAAEVYADAARTTALSHPLVADSQGRFPAIYPDPDRVYRVRLSDSSGVQQWEEEGVSLQMFMRTKREMDAGIVPRNYAYPPGDVRRYGADPTGDKNSSEAFRQATQSTHSVYIPEGIFLVSEVVSATGTVMWRGEGAKSVIRSDSTVLIVTNGTGSMIDNIYLENITPPLIIKRNPEN